MPSLKDLRNRINSVKSTRKITKAMQMVAAAKLRRAQDAAEAARPYAKRMSAVLANLSASMSPEAGGPRLLVGTGEDRVHLLVVATAERGLCGAFNASISKLAREHADRLVAEGKTVKILCVGRKGRDALRRTHGSRIIETIELAGVKRVGLDEAQRVTDRVLALFDEGAFDVCTLFFAEFRSVVSQVPTAKRIIPATIEDGQTGADLQGAVYEYEPDAEQILADLLPRNLTVQVLNALLENAASEQGARMTAMDNATRNAGDMIDKLTLNYNRTRQAIITKELIEIISGAEAL
ncbi:F0F1 ATP synthase subunit gamma [Futiania mangrovi]|uniref:ATP synthase gamma chain n=1 Tax=Futiania mangrovi TaxID=2959716 RepID=A0A9J6PDI6_9PROT|nr:F0F1 ATP synthase subunit gamma [Futiania mangrovii]MCP1336697.1 F0F1 ATP synthase subunit gamma [Futiania mangrovii]